MNTNNRFRLIWVGLVLCCLVFATVFVSRTTSANGDDESNSRSPSPLDDPNFPKEFDIRAIHGTPRGTDTPVEGLRFQNASQLKSLASLKNEIGLAANSDALRIEYNGLTATPRHLVNRDGYLSAPSQLNKEQIARNFIAEYRSMFRLSDDDLTNLKLTSRATSANGTTTMLFNQRVNGMPVFNGSVMVNVAENGQIANVGGDTFPEMKISNSVSISPEQAIQIAAADLQVPGFSPQSMGSTQVLASFGDLEPEFVTGKKYSRGSEFGDDIIVTQVVFPMGATGLIAYKFTLTTPQFYGIMWQHFVDAETGKILRRASLTSFQNHKGDRKIQREAKIDAPSFGPPGGGVGIGRRPTYRPDIQDYVESFNNPGTAQGKVFDTLPALLSGNGFGDSTRTGTLPANYVYTAPTYADEITTLTARTGRGFRYGQASGRNEFPLPWNNNPVRPTFAHADLPGLLGQLTRGFPDATNPTASSPFGWFYLPTDNGGAEITSSNANRTTTRANGYTMHADAVTRNGAFPGNSPMVDNTQPYSVDVTPLSATVNLADGRALSSVIQSRYTEGNNVLTADDRNNDHETTHGIKGYAVGRLFTAPYFDFYDGYFYGGIDATAGVFPPGSDGDVPAGTLSLFYFNNILHDYLYTIGFTEPFWNFQMDNFGKGGAGGDSISTQVQDGSGINNANFGTGDDGAQPRMQMFLFTRGSFRRSDGDFDFDVVAHEQFHGVSNRSAGKGGSGCLGITAVGESGGMGEGWGDWIAASMTDDDVAGDYVTGQMDIGIRKLPMTNYRYSYGAVNNRAFTVRRTDPGTAVAPDAGTGSATPFAVHATGELWSSMLWDMRELLIMKQEVGPSTFPGIFYDGGRRLGGGTTFYAGYRQLQSVDTFHPINYRPGFNTTNNTPPTTVPTITGAEHFIRPGMVAQEILTLGNRNGPLATAVSRGARLADQLMLRGLQLCPCNPSVVEMRDSILLADREMTGGENQAVIWRAFASHGAGVLARSTGGTGGTDPSGGGQSVPTVAEDFSVPADVTACESLGPLAAPTFSVVNTGPNSVTVSITAVPDATSYIIARSTSASGPFATVSTQAGVTYVDNPSGDSSVLILGQTYYYQVHAARNPACVGSANTMNVTITTGVAPIFPPVFFGVNTVTDPRVSTSLNLTWSPATSLNPSANIVYDIYRVTSITSANGQTDSTTAPTFVPAPGNRITPAGGVTGTSYVDTGLTLGQVYYYIVQARDLDNGTIDTLDTGNRVAKFSAPTSSLVASTPFSIEDFEAASANTRFTPLLIDRANPDVGTPQWQRAMNSSLLTTTTAMYAPDFDPTPPGDGTGAASDFNNFIGPITLTQASILEFDSRHSTEFAFDGGVVEVVLGTPGAPTTFPDNAVTFDLNYFLIENGYSGKLDGTLAGPVILSPLQGRFGFTGTRTTRHIRAALGSFRPGGAQNIGGAPVFLRFRSVSDVGTSPGVASGWYIDNLVVNDYGPFVGGGNEADVATRTTGDGLLQSNDVTQMRRFLNGSDTFDTGTNEFQRADSAPKATSGDAAIQSGDVVQTRRYLNGTDAPQSAGGATAPSGRIPEPADGAASNQGASTDKSGGRTLWVESTKATAGRRVTINLNMGAVGDESEYGFILDYDSAILSNPVIGAGNAGANARACNTTTPGRINCSVGAFMNNSRTSSSSGIGELLAGTDRTLITVTFNVVAEAKPDSTELTLSNVNVANDAAEQLTIGSKNGSVSISRSRAESVRLTGRVTTNAQRGSIMSGAELIDGRGRKDMAFTDPLGWFNFTSVGVRQNYVASVIRKDFSLETQVNFVNQAVCDMIDFPGGTWFRPRFRDSR